MGRKPLGVKNYEPSQIKALFNSDDKYKRPLQGELCHNNLINNNLYMFFRLFFVF
jgi:hypothetical protein